MKKLLYILSLTFSFFGFSQSYDYIDRAEKKIIEILEKRMGTMDKYVSFDVFDDCYITVDDYIYLQSFAAQNSFYLRLGRINISCRRGKRNRPFKSGNTGRGLCKGDAECRW